VGRDFAVVGKEHIRLAFPIEEVPVSDTPAAGPSPGF
jgi:hypothetical protein